MTKSVHDHYVTCGCGAQFSDPITLCPACGKPSPEHKNEHKSEPKGKDSTPVTDPAPTLNAADSKEDTVPPTERASAPTLNGKDP